VMPARETSDRNNAGDPWYRFITDRRISIFHEAYARNDDAAFRRRTVRHH
jgi:hypothetical protein